MSECRPLACWPILAKARMERLYRFWFNRKRKAMLAARLFEGNMSGSGCGDINLLLKWCADWVHEDETKGTKRFKSAGNSWECLRKSRSFQRQRSSWKERLGAALKAAHLSKWRINFCDNIIAIHDHWNAIDILRIAGHQKEFHCANCRRVQSIRLIALLFFPIKLLSNMQNFHCLLIKHLNFPIFSLVFACEMNFNFIKVCVFGCVYLDCLPLF